MAHGVEPAHSGRVANQLVHNLHRITGKIGKPGSTPLSLTGQPNACGGVRDNGTLSHLLNPFQVGTQDVYFQYKVACNQGLGRVGDWPMGLDSPLFLFVFLPVLLGMYAITPSRLRGGLLLVASLAFYALTAITSLPVFLVSIAFNMVMGMALAKAPDTSRPRLLILGVAANLAFLAYAKYFTFFFGHIPALAGLAPKTLPLGVSFFTFSAVAYLVDVSRRVCPAETNPIRFGLFLAFFAKITAGPIARVQDMRDHAGLSLEDVTEGFKRFAFGLGKKVLIAGQVGALADAAFSERAGNLDMGTAWLGLVCYALQLYFDFSGYTDMAVGLGRIFGYRLPENFNYPYTAQSVREFWRRWHMTLSSWFRDYLYIPLGGGRVAPWRVQLNLLIVFTLCGLWHGASWSFVVWGLWHGLFLVLERTFVGKALDRAPRPLRHLYALLAVGLGWVFFRAADFGVALNYFQALGGLSGGSFDYTWMMRMNHQFLVALVVGVLGCTPVVGWISNQLIPAEVDAVPGPSPWTVRWAGILLPPAIMAAAVLQLAAGSHAPFIYAQF